jgi:hypothetical protein
MVNDVPITPDVAAAYCLCKRKAFLLLQGEECEATHQYVVLTEAQAAASLKTFIASSERAGLTIQHCNGAELTGKADVLAQVSLRADDLHATADALVSLEKPVGKGHPIYEPHLAIGSHCIDKADKISLAFIGHVLGIEHRRRPHTGVIINGAGHLQRMQLATLMAFLEPAIDTLKAWKGDHPAQRADRTQPPPKPRGQRIAGKCFGSTHRLEFELGAWFEGACGFALVLALSQITNNLKKRPVDLQPLTTIQ